jgi:hypothetical protein
MKTISESSSMTVAEKRAAFLGAAVVIAIAALAPASAFANEPEHARADALFREGRSLLDAKKYDAACSKLAESQKLEPGSGTLLALAMCHEGQGRTATAHRDLLDAAALAKKVGRPDLAAAAEKRARALEPTLTKLAIKLPEDDAPYAVKLDDEPVADDAKGKPLFVDPGEHRVVASAAGRVSRSYVVRVSGAATIDVVVDKLDEEQKPAPAPVVAPVKRTPAPVEVTDEELTHVSGPERASSGSSGTAQRVIGLTLAGAGVGGLVAAGIFGGQAVSARSESRTSQGAAAEAANERAKDKMMASVVSGSVGVVALAVGTILVVTAPSSKPTTVGQSNVRARFVPLTSPSEVGAGFVGTF